jgi:hypothetical protein
MEEKFRFNIETGLLDTNGYDFCEFYYIGFVKLFDLENQKN